MVSNLDFYILHFKSFYKDNSDRGPLSYNRFRKNCSFINIVS